ncbi:hypothetical protein HHI36_009692 [Cryptolaemus montrouzieri]|uniref:Uncharacterized protein n=1 Tax=Cryptolaemus montrouzieri TaxID=559131 RepID=A0ABD2MGM2_9CUCU
MKVVWHDIKTLKVKKERPRTFLYKTSYQDENFRTVNMVGTSKKTRSQANAESVRLVRAYTDKIPLVENKERLERSCNKLAENIPPHNGVTLTQEIGSRSLSIEPTDIQEVEKVLKEMKKDCTPGSDNVTALDVLNISSVWGFVSLTKYFKGFQRNWKLLKLFQYFKRDRLKI